MGKFEMQRILLLAVLSGALYAGTAFAKEDSFPSGISIGEVSLEGMTKEEAGVKIRSFVQDKAGCRVVVWLDGASAETTAGELGYAWANPEVIEEAYARTCGNLIERYMARKDLEKEPVCLELKAEVDSDLFQAFVEENCEQLERRPQNASITRMNGGFKITSESDGFTIDLEATRERINAALDGEGDEASVEAAVIEIHPDITEEMLSTIGDVLGSFSTDFGSSGTSRAGNLKNGASKINGQVLMPGETLSGYGCMHPFTEENGYFTAAAYENGQVVDSIGGGVCQIATTLYNAALLAELAITQRQNHSMIVTYVEPSMDAAIAGTYKDIKITNNYSTPIYIEGGTSGSRLTFTIYGRDTRPGGREIQYVSETLSTTDPGAPEKRIDPSLPPGTQKQVQSAHIGRKSRLWKIVKVNGMETERLLLHEDTYHPAKAVILVGPEESTAPSQIQTLLPDILPSLENKDLDALGSLPAEETAAKTAEETEEQEEEETRGKKTKEKETQEKETDSHERENFGGD